jgi:uncharacterized protein (DUF302 family)
MIREIAVEHVTFVTDRRFDEVVRGFEEQVGTLEEAGWSSIPAASTDKEDFERRVEDVLGPSGFTRFLTIDHGDWLSKEGHAKRIRMYVLGNPLIAITMMQHHVEAGLDVPVRLAIYEDADGSTKVVFNKPSTLMSALGDEKVQAAASKLDAKMLALGEAITGVSA